MYKKYNLFLSFLIFFSVLTNAQKVSLKKQGIKISSNQKNYLFAPSFKLLYRVTDPKLAMRPAGIKKVKYNVPTWLAYKDKKADLKDVKKSEATGGDGLDDRILKGGSEKRTPNYFNSGLEIDLLAKSFKVKKDTIFWEFPTNEYINLKAHSYKDINGFQKLVFSYITKKEGYFSVGYTGAPVYKLADVKEIWQPFVWQEKRFPDNAYLTLSYRAPLPTTFVKDDKNTIGVLATPEELPFQPLPIQKNSEFGIMVRNQNGDAQTQIYAPVLGGQNSKMKPNETFKFTTYLIVENLGITETYEKLAREIYGFRDFRNNDLGSLNSTLDRIIDYGNSKYSRYVDSLKGFEYSTDVPGAVKNVSSLSPIQIALITDNKELFDKKAYPMIEFMVSREKLLFALDKEQKIQHPSRKMNGKAATISELTALYNIFNRENDFLIDMAKKVNKRKLGRDPESIEKVTKNWINAMLIYKATNEKAYLESAIKGADEYLKLRVDKIQEDFNDPIKSRFFFWDAFTNKWVELLELYEITGDKKYLKAARDGARRYTLHTWMSPRVPENTDVLVNKDGKAPLYWYLKSKGHKQMYLPEEKVPAWRLSEIGLTPESSGTSTGHRAIFMANYAPSMLRVGYLTNDQFLKDVAKAAIIGRYKNFPGYHINTARTTAYEKEDYPLRKHKELSVNSFHYNHAIPMSTMLIDYLVSDTWARSREKIDFPSEFIEGYGYLKNKFYGIKKGRFYDIKEVQFWMPERLLKQENKQLNYLTGRKDNQLLIAFTNQTNKIQKSKITLNKDLLNTTRKSKISKIWVDNIAKSSQQKIEDYNFNVEVSPNGITAVLIDGINAKIKFQQKVLQPSKVISSDFKDLKLGKGRAMIFNLGEYAKKAFIYLEKDDAVFKKVTLTYKDFGGKEHQITDTQYPFEFTVDLNQNQKKFDFQLKGITVRDIIRTGDKQTIGK